MNGTQELIKKIKNATKTIDYSNLSDSNVNNLRVFFDRHIELYGDKNNWKMATETRIFDPTNLRQGINSLLEICGLVQALLYFHGGYNIWEDHRGCIAVSSDGYYIYVGA